MRLLVPDKSVHDVTEAGLRQGFLLATEPWTAALTCSGSLGQQGATKPVPQNSAQEDDPA